MPRPVIAFTVLGLLVVGCGDASSREIRLPRAPYLGLACRGPVSPCARIGLAVWLPRSARSVSAVVHGHSCTLRTGSGTGAYRRGLFWQGFFADRRAEHLAADWPHLLAVRLRVVATDGTVLLARGSAPVSSGYG